MHVQAARDHLGRPCVSLQKADNTRNLVGSFGMQTLQHYHSQQCRFTAPSAGPRLLTRLPGHNAQLAAHIRSQRAHRARKTCVTSAAEDGVEGLELGIVSCLCSLLACISKDAVVFNIR